MAAPNREQIFTGVSEQPATLAPITNDVLPVIAELGATNALLGVVLRSGSPADRTGASSEAQPPLDERRRRRQGVLEFSAEPPMGDGDVIPASDPPPVPSQYSDQLARPPPSTGSLFSESVPCDRPKPTQFR